MTTSRRSYKQKKAEIITTSLKKYHRVISIDPGTHTGIGVADCVDRDNVSSKKKLVMCQGTNIHKALKLVEDMLDNFDVLGYNTLVIIEDGRNISGDKSKLLGAGSLRRDCSIWEDFLNDLSKEYEGFDVRFVRPTGNVYLKCNEKLWAQLVKFEISNKLPNEHGRDAATYLIPYLN